MVSEVELRFCELLIHHGEEQAIAALVEAFVPPELLAHADTRALYEAWLRTRHGEPDALTRLSESGGEGVRRMLVKLVRSDPRMAHAREATTREATEEIIARLWIARLETERRPTLEEQRRLEITTRLKLLKKPKSQQELYDALTAERTRLATHPLPAAMPLPPASAATVPSKTIATDEPLPPVAGDLPEEDPF